MNRMDSAVDNLADDLSDTRLDRLELLQRAAALGITLSAAGGFLPDAAFAQSSGTLRVRQDSDPKSYDPAFFIGYHEGLVMAQIYEGLIGYRPGTWEVVNVLADSFKVSPSGTRIDFVLKRGIQFHGGYGEVTAQDVKFSYERIAGLTRPKLTSPNAGDWAPLRSVKVTGKYSGTILLKTPFAPLLRTTLPLTSGYIVSRKAVRERGDRFGTRPIGTGPYQVTGFTPSQRTTLKRFPGYRGPQPAWASIVAIPITQDQAAAVALESGAIDFGILPVDAVDRFRRNSKFRVVALSSLDYVWLAMNVLHPKLADINVRRAIRAAVDVPTILRIAYSARAGRASAIIPKSMGLGYWADAPVYNRNLGTARGFLRAAGVSSLELDFFAPGYQAYGFDWKTAAQIIQANLAEIGINTNIQLLDIGSFGSISVGDNLDKLQLGLNGFGSAPDPYYSFVWHTCDQVRQYNEMGWCNREYTRLNEVAARTSDAKKRNAVYVKMQRLMDRACHSVYIAHPTRYYASRRNIVQVHRPDGREPQLKAFRTA